MFPGHSGTKLEIKTLKKLKKKTNRKQNKFLKKDKKRNHKYNGKIPNHLEIKPYTSKSQITEEIKGNEKTV